MDLSGLQKISTDLKDHARYIDDLIKSGRNGEQQRDETASGKNQPFYEAKKKTGK